MTLTFENLVRQEFGKEFNVYRYKDGHVARGLFACKIDYKKNPSDLAACCCPGIVQQYGYTLTLGGAAPTKGAAPKVHVEDNITGLNRTQAAMAQTNISNQIQMMNNQVFQAVSRIETQLILEHQNNNATIVAAVPASVVVPEVQAEVMEERVLSVADEVLKLKQLHDDGVLNDEEFEQAKKNALSPAS